MEQSTVLEQSPLGKGVQYNNQYDPSLLFPIARALKRAELGIHESLPFCGFDVWNAFELSWLNAKGKPRVAVAILTVPAESPTIFESKSLKLYLNSFNGTRFASRDQVERQIKSDLTALVGMPVGVALQGLDACELNIIGQFAGINIDDCDVAIDHYTYNPDFLAVGEQVVNEGVYSHLLKSNCPITKQPDWGSVFIRYTGRQIIHEGLLKYIVSLRDHDEFHEQCVERMFVDIMRYCKPQELLVYARYTRRGGIDINPLRATPGSSFLPNMRLIRQ